MHGSAVDRDDLERAWLAHYGAPLYGRSLVRGQAAPKAEDVLAAALDLAHRDASVARALPVAFWRQRGHLDFGELARRAREIGSERELGFFLELTARLGNDAKMLGEARALRPPVPHVEATDFFPVRGPLEREAGVKNSPPVALEWGFRMNMGMDSFQSMFEKAAR